MRRGSPVNLAAVDLNLLVAFEALLAQRSLTRAGDRIGLAQSSMSSALARLRLLFDDELFVRTPRGMQPTSRALGLAARIDEALRQVRSAFHESAGFTPGSDARHFRVGGGDHADFAVAVPLIAALRERAPASALTIISVIGELAAGVRAAIKSPAPGALPPRCAPPFFHAGSRARAIHESGSSRSEPRGASLLRGI
jgi:DNA-binding transcriptional LysR family regulator